AAAGGARRTAGRRRPRCGVSGRPGTLQQGSLALFDAVPEAIVVVGGEGEIAFANRRAQDLFGYTAEELAGMAAERLVPARHRQGRGASGRIRALAARTGRATETTVELHGLRSDGVEFPAVLTLASVELDGAPAAV